MAALAHRPRRSGIPIPAVPLIGILLGGCIGLFRPDKPEPPSQGSGGIELDYSSHEHTLATLARGIAAKGPNGQAAYLRAFADPTTDQVSLTVVFDPEVTRRFEGGNGQVPTWNLDYERNFYSSLLRVSSYGYYMVWDFNAPAGSDDISSDGALLHRKYHVYTVDAQGSAIGVVAVGLADLTLKKVAPSRWAIVRWEDRVDPSVGIDPSDHGALSFSARRLESLSAP